MIPSTTWFNNVRSCFSRSSWGKLRKQVYERVDYKCECCSTDCRVRTSYKGSDYVDDVSTAPSSDFNGNVERIKWNAIQLEAHERWSYDYDNNIQKLERIFALCRRCHTATHLGLADLRGVKHLAFKHMKKVNGWDDKQVKANCDEQSSLYRKRSPLNWKLNIDIVTNSGFQVSNKSQTNQIRLEDKKQNQSLMNQI